MKYNDMITALKTDACYVNFVKKDGTDRNMKCTLNFDMIPVKDHPKQIDILEEQGVLNTIRAVRVYDLSINEWRSFLLDSVRDFNGVEGPINKT